MLETLTNIIPLGALIVVVIGIALTIFRLPDAVTSPIKAALTPVAAEVGRQAEVILRSSWGKRLVRIAIIAFLAIICLSGAKHAWEAYGRPIVTSVSTSATTNSTNRIAQSVYDKTSAAGGSCTFHANPFVGRNDIRHKITITASAEGNSLIIDATVTHPEETWSARIGIRTMEFSGERDHTGTWSVARSSWTYGAFEDDESFDASMLHVLGIAAEIPCET